MNMTYVQHYLTHTERQADGWPVGITEEGKAYCSKLAAGLLAKYESVTLTHFENALRGDLAKAPPCVQQSTYKTALCHRALLSVNAVECYRATALTPKV